MALSTRDCRDHQQTAWRAAGLGTGVVSGALTLPDDAKRVFALAMCVKLRDWQLGSTGHAALPAEVAVHGWCRCLALWQRASRCMFGCSGLSCKKYSYV